MAGLAGLIVACDDRDAPVELVTATGQDGSRLTLTGPPSAVPGGVTLTASVLSRADASAEAPIPFGLEFVAGGRFGPDGTVFASPLTLTFTLPEALSKKDPLSLQTSRNGAWVATGTLAAVSADGRTLTAEVSHFSSFSVFRASDGGEVRTGTVTLATRGFHDSDGFIFATATAGPGHGGSDIWPEMDYFRLGLNVGAVGVAPFTGEAPVAGYATDAFTVAPGQWYAISLSDATYAIIAIRAFVNDGYDPAHGPRGRVVLDWKHRPDGGRLFR